MSNTVVLIILLVVLGGWGGAGWYNAQQGPGPYAGGWIVHLIVTITVLVLCLRVLGVR